MLTADPQSRDEENSRSRSKRDMAYVPPETNEEYLEIVVSMTIGSLQNEVLQGV